MRIHERSVRSRFAVPRCPSAIRWQSVGSPSAHPALCASGSPRKKAPLPFSGTALPEAGSLVAIEVSSLRLRVRVVCGRRRAARGGNERMRIWGGGLASDVGGRWLASSEKICRGGAGRFAEGGMGGKYGADFGLYTNCRFLPLFGYSNGSGHWLECWRNGASTSRGEGKAGGRWPLAGLRSLSEGADGRGAEAERGLRHRDSEDMPGVCRREQGEAGEAAQDCG